MEFLHCLARASVVTLPDLVKLVLIHGKLSDVLPLHLVHVGAAENQTVQRRAQIHTAQLPKRSGHNLLPIAAQPRNANSQLVLAANALLPRHLRLHHLLRALRRRHEPRRLVHDPPARQRLQIRLLHLYIQQYQSMQPKLQVVLDAVVEAVRLPAVGEEDHADRLAEGVQAQARGSHGREDGGVGQRARFDGRVVLAAAQGEVGVRGRAEGVADHEEGDVLGVGFGQDVVGAAFDHFAVGDYDGPAIVGFLLRGRGVSSLAVQGMAFRGVNVVTHEYALVDEQDCCVGFEVDALGLFDDLQTLDRDVFLVGQAETNDVKHFRLEMCLLISGMKCPRL